MSLDKSPPQNSQQQHVRSDSPSNNTPSASAAGSRRMPTPGQSSRRGSVDSSAPQDPADVNESLSRPMTASASPDADATATEPPSASATPAPSGYGTRSSRRNAASRPNYAEDRDIDVDLEVHNSASKTSKRGGAASNLTNGTRTDGEKSSSRKSLTAANGSNSTAARDGIPGTSSFLAKPDEVNSSSSSSRKRKQPASSTPTSTNENASKKVFTAAPGITPGQGDSNMVTFDDGGAYLKNGKITADDGTTFSANGQFNFSLSSFSFIICVLLFSIPGFCFSLFFFFFKTPTFL